MDELLCSGVLYSCNGGLGMWYSVFSKVVYGHLYLEGRCGEGNTSAEYIA